MPCRRATVGLGPRLSRRLSCSRLAAARRCRCRPCPCFCAAAMCADAAAWCCFVPCRRCGVVGFPPQRSQPPLPRCVAAGADARHLLSAARRAASSGLEPRRKSARSSVPRPRACILPSPRAPTHLLAHRLQKLRSQILPNVRAHALDAASKGGVQTTAISERGLLARMGGQGALPAQICADTVCSLVAMSWAR